MKDALEDALDQLRRVGLISTQNLFTEILERHPHQHDHVYRQRSMALAELQHFSEAGTDRDKVIANGRPGTSDFYFAGEYWLQAGRFNTALDRFEAAIRMCKATNSDYYLSSSTLLAALAAYQLNDDQRARQYLDQVPDDVEVLWLQGFDRVTKEMLREALDKP